MTLYSTAKQQMLNNEKDIIFCFFCVFYVAVQVGRTPLFSFLQFQTPWFNSVPLI